MHYFSGFSLQNESELFDFWLDKSKYTVAGFSAGAIEALEYVLNSKNRVDRLILLSPAFFNDKDIKYKRVQLLHFKKNPNKYITNFLFNATGGNSDILKKYLKNGEYEELEKLLNYNWDIEKLKNLKSKGIEIEVILGEKDKIINSNKALEFFKEYVTVYFIKEANHILTQIKDS